MGTITDQPERDPNHVTATDVLDRIDIMNSVAREANVTFDQAVAVWRVMEQARSNNLAVANGDVHDEQMAGMYEAACDLTGAMVTGLDSMAAALTHVATELHYLTKLIDRRYGG